MIESHTKLKFRIVFQGKRFYFCFNLNLYLNTFYNNISVTHNMMVEFLYQFVVQISDHNL